MLKESVHQLFKTSCKYTTLNAFFKKRMKFSAKSVDNTIKNN